MWATMRSSYLVRAPGAIHGEVEAERALIQWIADVNDCRVASGRVDLVVVVVSDG